MNDATIIYCSSCREDPLFEAKVKETILKHCGGLPIISVTQKPIDFGKNICVGDSIGASGFNFFRQVQIGLMEAKTEFVISAESDCMYPPDYFTFRPERNDKCYRSSNLYVMPDLRAYYFYKREGATHAQIVGREFYLNALNKLFEGAPQWSTEEKNFPKERHNLEDVFADNDIIRHKEIVNPVFQVKTHKGLRYYTHSDCTPIAEIKYWGPGEPIRKWLIKGKEYENKPWEKL